MSRKKKILLLVLTLLVLLGVFWWRADRANAPDLGTNRTSRGDQIDSSQAVQFDKSKYSTTDPASIWVVVNKQRPLNPLSYEPDDLVAIGNGHRLRQEAASALQQLVGGAKADGHNITGLSGYRSYSRQQTIYANEVKQYGQAVADSQSARPGYSEHQTGLTVDVGGGGCNIDDCFGDTAEGKWVAANAHKYGFIVRYVPGKEDITGYRYEPWHIRYVGVELATEMHNTGVQTLEEFFEL